MTIDRQPWHTERVSENHVGRFPANSRQLNQLGHRPGDLAAMLLDNLTGHAEKRSGLRPEETGGLDLRLEFSRSGLRQRSRVRVALEERRRDLIHSLVGTLRG